jgi:Peptidase family M23/Repeat of unknown function (DUF346)
MLRALALATAILLALFVDMRDQPIRAADQPLYTLPFFQAYVLTCGFHGVPGCPGYTSHDGTDYQLGDPATGGEYVVAALGGSTAYFEDFPNRYGKFIVIDHGSGHRTRYLHLQSQAVAYGPSVSAGQLVGYEGNTGGPWCQDPPTCNDWQSPYHLHFETRENATPGDCCSGTAVDPYSTGAFLWTTNPPSYQEGESVGVASWASNRLDLFVRGNNGAMYHRWWDGSAWSGWEYHPGCLRGGPAAVSRMTNRVDVFVRGCGDHLHKKSWNGSNWSDWQDLGGCLRSEPAVVSWGSTRLDVFVRGCYDALHWTYSDNSGSSWSNWQDLGGCVNAAPGAATWGGNHLAAFVRGCGNGLHRNYWFGGSWSGFNAPGSALGGCLGAGPGADSWGVNRLDVFIRGCADTAWHNYSSDGGVNYSGFIEPAGCITSGTGVTSRAVNLLDVFARGCGARDMLEKSWNGASWSGWNFLFPWP